MVLTIYTVKLCKLLFEMYKIKEKTCLEHDGQ